MKFTLCLLSLLLITSWCSAQQWLAPRAHVHIATDAEVVLASVQPGVGAQLSFSRKLGVALDYYHFSGRYTDTDPMWPVDAWQKHHTLALMGTYQLSRGPHQGMYLMTGVALQSRQSAGSNNFRTWTDNRNFITAALELGHRWPLGIKGYGMAIACKATGPLSYTENFSFPGDPTIYTNSTTEILTQLSIGLVLDKRIILRK